MFVHKGIKGVLGFMYVGSFFQLTTDDQTVYLMLMRTGETTKVWNVTTKKLQTLESNLDVYILVRKEEKNDQFSRIIPT